MMSDICIRRAQRTDIPDILRIYNEAVIHLVATFDLVEQTLEQRTEWFEQLETRRYPILVAEDQTSVVGYCSLAPYKEKPAYAKTVELSLYIDRSYRGQGIGSKLMAAIIVQAQETGFHTILSGITGGNEASVKLHEKHGFVVAGCLKEVGYKFGEWRDVYFYQLLLNSHS